MAEKPPLFCCALKGQSMVLSRPGRQLKKAQQQTNITKSSNFTIFPFGTFCSCYIYAARCFTREFPAALKSISVFCENYVIEICYTISKYYYSSIELLY